MPIALRAVFGQDEVSHGTERYRVGGDHVVYVPETAAYHLLHNAGFHMVKTAGPAHVTLTSRNSRSQMLVMVHHPNGGACSYGGAEYLADENGNVLVPADAVGDLMSHGFVPTELGDCLQQCRSAWANPRPAGEYHGNVRRRPLAAANGEPRGSAQ